MSGPPTTPDWAIAPVHDLVERVFGAVIALRDRVAPPSGRPPDPAADPPPPAAVDVPGLRVAVRSLLAAHRDIAVGMGMIVAPGVPVPSGRRVLWWQDLPGRAEPSPLQVDLNPHSLGFYDYGSADWFSVPRESGGRHVDGPYVDVHGTDRYLLTFTVPVAIGDRFLGVVGADVPVARFESRLLAAWGERDRDRDVDVVVVNAEQRVVVSNSVRALAGDLAGEPAGRPAGVDVPGVHWRVLLRPRLGASP